MATEEFVDATIKSLKIMGMVPKHGRLCVRRGRLCLETNDHTVVQGIRRWLRGDSRDVVYEQASATLSGAFIVTRSLMAIISTPTAVVTGQSRVDLWTLGRMLTEMGQCEAGLQNLRETYATDSTMVANIEVLIERLRKNCAEVSEFLGARPDGSRDHFQTDHS